MNDTEFEMEVDLGLISETLVRVEATYLSHIDLRKVTDCIYRLDDRVNDPILI